MNEIREAVEYLSTAQFCIDDHKHINVLLSLAEQVLEAKWVEKKDLKGYTDGHGKNSEAHIADIFWNSATDACLLAHVAQKARILEGLSEEKIKELFDKTYDEWDSKGIWHWVLAQSIRRLVEEVICANSLA